MVPAETERKRLREGGRAWNNLIAENQKCEGQNEVKRFVLA